MNERPIFVSINSINISSDQTLNISPNDIILLVGPNNAGKSKLLREINDSFGKKTDDVAFINNLILKKLDIQIKSSKEILRSYLRDNSSLEDGHYRYQDTLIPDTWLVMYSNDAFSDLAGIFRKNIGVETRLSITSLQQGVGVGKPKTKPQHYLYDSVSLLNTINLRIKEAFGVEIFFDYRSNPDIPIHIGRKPTKSANEESISDSYVEKVRACPRLDQQGDGVKSFVGILFEATVFQYDVTLLDEPEAFLHPPQMRKLGRILAEETANQLIVATHSSDIVKGFLEGKSANVRIWRITRKGSKNFVTETTQDQIRQLWQQPELRYSNALDGVFHELAVICEHDADCRLYHSVGDFIASRKRKSGIPDTAYIPTGGKHAIPKIASALHQIGVPVKIIVDLDFLSEADLVQKCVESLGGDWGHYVNDHKILDSEVRKGVKPKTSEEIADAIRQELEDLPADGFPKSKIHSLLKDDNPWSIVKKSGKLSIPNGDAQKAFNRLDEKLRELGIFVVPVGEIENFCGEIGAHGPKFVSRLLQEKSLDDSALSELRKFVEDVIIPTD